MSTHTITDSRLVHAFLGLCATLLIAPGCLVGDADADADMSSDEENVAEGSFAISWSEHDYLFVLTPGNWDQAVTTCKDMGYYLVTINTAAEQNWIYSQIAPKGTSYQYWLGLNDKAFEGTWVWNAGASLYKNWQTGQPDNSNNQDCTTIYAANGKWYDQYCTNSYRIICERNY